MQQQFPSIAGLQGTKRSDEKKAYKSYVKHIIDEDYSFICIKKCFNDFLQPLVPAEKVCLAKCQDRAYDYLI